MIKKFTITSKIIMLSVLLVALSSTLVGAIFYYSNNRNIALHATEQLSHRIDALIILVHEQIKRPHDLLQHLANTSEFKRITMSPTEYVSNFQTLSEAMMEQNEDILELVVALKEKNKILKISRSVSSTPTTSISDYQQEQLPPIANGKTVHINQVDKDGMIIVSYIVPVLIGNSTVGHLYLKSNASSILNKLKMFSSKELEFAVVDPEGHYLMKGAFMTPFNSVLPSILRDYPELSSFLTNAKAHLYTTPRTNFHPNIALHVVKLAMKDGDAPLALISGVYNYETQIRDFDTVRKRSIITSVLLIILSAIFSVILSKFLTRGLMSITSAAKQYMDGNEDVVLPIGSSDEIALLANTFQGMIHRVNERSRRIKRSEEKSLRAKEQAEAAQMAAEEARLQAEEAYSQKSILLADVQRQKEKIEEISKDKDDLMAIVSHDLKNPLAVIDSGIGLIRDTEQSLSPESIELLMRSQASARFAINLITDLLDLARLEGGIKLEKDWFSVRDLFSAAFYAFELPASDRRISLEMEVPDNFSLHADYARVLQILNNLIGNAIKFTPPGGRILLTASKDQIHPKSIHITLADNGRGIPDHKLQSIFNKYEQAQSNDRKTGTGLGLAICHRITQMHEGQIYVESEEGSGSTFHLILPGLDANAHTPKQFIPKAHLAPTGQNIPHVLSKHVRKVLLIDDSEDIEALIRMMLASEKIEFDWAADGRSGVLAYMKGKHDLILMDLNMPVMNGLKTTQIIRALESKMGMEPATILAITASSDEESRRQCVMAGCNGTLNKPIKKDTLLRALGRKVPDKQAA